MFWTDYTLKPGDMVRQGTDWYIIDTVDPDGTVWGSMDDDGTPYEIIPGYVDVYLPAEEG